MNSSWAPLIIIGAFELARAFSLRKTGRILAVALFGLVALPTGALLLLFPIRGVAALTLVVAAFLIASGLVKMWGAFGWRPRRGWPWTLASGVLSVILGGLLLAMMPIGAFWALGLLIGIDLLFFGAAQLAFAMQGSTAPGEAA